MREDWGVDEIQVAFLAFAVVAPTTILTLPRILARVAGQDGWAAALLGLPAGLLPLAALGALDRRSPGATFGEQAAAELGPLGGRLATAAAALLFGLLAAIVTREVADAVQAENLPRTPLPAVVALVLWAPVVAARQGLETMARWAQLLVGGGLCLLLLLLLGSARDLHPEYLLPLFGHGWRPLLAGAVSPASFYVKSFVLAYVLPFRGGGRRAAYGAALAGLGAGALLLALTAAVTVALFGPLAASFPQPVFEAARLIALAEFLTHLDAVAVAVWLALGLAKLGLVFLAFVLALADLFDLRQPRPATLPAAALTGALAVVEFRSNVEFQDWLFTVWPAVSAGLVLLPAAVLAGGLLRERRRSRKTAVTAGAPPDGRPERGK